MNYICTLLVVTMFFSGFMISQICGVTEFSPFSIKQKNTPWSVATHDSIYNAVPLKVDTVEASRLSNAANMRYVELRREIDSLLRVTKLDSAMRAQFENRFANCRRDFELLDSLYKVLGNNTDSIELKLPELIHNKKTGIDMMNLLRNDILKIGSETFLYDSVEDTIVTAALIGNSENKDSFEKMGGAQDMNQEVDSLDNRFINAVFEGDTTSLRGLLTGFDKESLKRAWEMYRRLGYDSENGRMTSLSYAGGDTLLAVSNALAESKIQSVETTINEAGEVVSKQYLPTTVDDFVNEFVTTQQSKQNKIDGVLFFVQICAAKQPLNDHYLGTKYKGNLAVVERTEDGWYKYQIGETADYKEIKRTLKESGVRDAFVVAYQAGKKLSLWQVLHSTPDDTYGDFTQSSKGLVFGVQLMATKRQLEMKDVKKYYLGSRTIYINYEDGWYKYFVITGNEIREAVRETKQVKTEGAFVIAYYNGRRISTKEALMKQQTNK